MSVLKELRIPHMGSVENAKMLAWLVEEGAAYREGDALYEVETDKTAAEVEADEAGVLVRQLAESDLPMKVGDLVGLWTRPGTSQADIDAALAERDDAGQAPAAAPVATASVAPAAALPVGDAEGGQRLSPLVRRLASEHGVDPATVVGSGPGGRITGEDILAAAGRAGETAAGDADSETIPHSLRRQTIARRMTEAAAIPTLTADMDVDLSALFERRAAEKASGQAASIFGHIAHAAVAIVHADRRFNAHWTDAALIQFDGVHLGIAVDTPEGLVVPVIRNAETLDPAGLTTAIAMLVERARNGKLAADELQGGTFTISNPGSLGPVTRAEALLNPPQIALLGLAGIVQTPRAIERDGAWQVEVRPVIRLSLSFDHRAIDGGPVIGFLNSVRGRLEV